MKTVSIVMPVYNEEKYIGKCMESLFFQDYPLDRMEWIFVDGCSKDNTLRMLSKYRDDHPQLIKIFNNTNKTVPYAMNIGIANASGKYIIRLDAHAEYANDYISRCVYYLDTTDAMNVGGVAETKSHGYVGSAIAMMLSSKFGVGNSRFRTNGKSGYVDTVPFGAFKREVFEKYGGYDVRLTRNQDNEMNYRIRKNGGKIYMSDDIKFSYYCRDSIKGISDMAFQNGRWNVITSKLCPGAMGIRHFMPLNLLLSFILLPLAAVVLSPVIYLFLIEICLYFILDLAYSLKDSGGINHAPLLFVLFPVFHFTYGFGSLIGLLHIIRGRI